jgi:hypothetical protein
MGARLLGEYEEKSAGCCDSPWGAVERVGHHPRPDRVWIEAKTTPSRSQACQESSAFVVNTRQALEYEVRSYIWSQMS